MERHGLLTKRSITEITVGLKRYLTPILVRKQPLQQLQITPGNDGSTVLK